MYPNKTELHVHTNAGNLENMKPVQIILCTFSVVVHTIDLSVPCLGFQFLVYD